MSHFITKTVALTVMLTLWTTVADARFIRADAASDNAEFNGEIWDSVTGLNLEGGATSSALNIGFDLEIAPGVLVDELTVSENGRIDFGTAGFIEVFVPASGDVTSIYSPPIGVEEVFAEDGQISVTSGQLDRNPDPANVGAEDAYRVHWNRVAVDGAAAPVSFQAIFIDLGSGNFDLELNYDYALSVNSLPAGLGAAALSFPGGATVAPYSGPFITDESGGYDFSFRNGLLVSGNPFSSSGGDPVPVPEPSTFGLLGVGLLAGWVIRRRQRVTA